MPRNRSSLRFITHCIERAFILGLLVESVRRAFNGQWDAAGYFVMVAAVIEIDDWVNP